VKRLQSWPPTRLTLIATASPTDVKIGIPDPTALFDDGKDRRTDGIYHIKPDTRSCPNTKPRNWNSTQVGAQATRHPSRTTWASTNRTVSVILVEVVTEPEVVVDCPSVVVSVELLEVTEIYEGKTSDEVVAIASPTTGDELLGSGLRRLAEVDRVTGSQQSQPRQSA
jgi:hypothetical protein